MKINLKNKVRSGFTLIELLIVMAILGVLAVVVLVAINPVQQLARTRDTGRKSTIAQLGRAMEAYYTAHNGVYVPEGTNWINTLVTSGEISTAPSAIAYGITTITGSCTGNTPPNWCYDATTAAGGEPVIVYSRLESTSEISKCTVATPSAFFVWSTAQGRGGLVCTTGAVPTAAGVTFVD